MAFILALFGSVAVQKNTRDIKATMPQFAEIEPAQGTPE